MLLAWGTKVSDEFVTELFKVVRGLGWHDTQASDLMSCMAFESGRTFNPSIRNQAGSGAVGLIQFMPATAKALGTSVDELMWMSAVEQLVYVSKYFRPYAKDIHNIQDMYMGILYPRYIKAEPSRPVFIEPAITYRQNAGLDLNKDGIITKAEICKNIEGYLQEGLEKYAKDVTDTIA